MHLRQAELCILRGKHDVGCGRKCAARSDTCSGDDRDDGLAYRANVFNNVDEQLELAAQCFRVRIGQPLDIRTCAEHTINA